MTLLRSESIFSVMAAVALFAAQVGVAAAEADSPAFPTTELIDPNSASLDELASVPGMNPAAAAEIVNERPFKTQSALDAAIGDALDGEGRKSVYAHVFIKVGLNSGAEEDYKLIPSTMSAGKLAHEFEEYRPYDSLEQFSREMSKYVSDEEVAYLARFVTLD
ncbi:MAG: ComEA family DNA-binding protein [Woeseiaceae bacterium]